MYRTIEYPNGSKYVGEFNERNKMHGEGTIYLPDGSSFSGKFKDDYAIEGTYLYDNIKYVGKVHDDGKIINIWGKGITYYPDGSIYVGHHMNGKRNLKGTLYWPNGTIEKGIWLDNRLSKGVVMFEEGTSVKGRFLIVQDKLVVLNAKKTDWCNKRFEGKISDYKLEGEASLYYYKNRLLYKGELLNNLYHGQGTSYYLNGDVYEGKFQNGSRHGKGVYTTAINILKCTWKNGELNGTVTEENKFLNKIIVYKYKDGMCLETVSEEVLNPNIKNEKINFKNGSMYIGEVKDNKPNGIGFLYFDANNKQSYISSIFKNGKANGKGRCVTSTYMYNGEFKNGKLHGKGELEYKEDKLIIRGDFKKGDPCGYCELLNYTKEISTIEGIYKKSKFKGNVYINFIDGRQYYGMVKDSLPHGQGKMKYPDGTFIIGSFKKGKPDGEVIILEDNKKYEARYKKDKLIKKREYLLEIK